MIDRKFVSPAIKTTSPIFFRMTPHPLMLLSSMSMTGIQNLSLPNMNLSSPNHYYRSAPSLVIFVLMMAMLLIE